MSIPAAVQRQGDEADAFLAKLNEQHTEAAAAEPTAVETPPATEAAVATPPAITPTAAPTTPEAAPGTPRIDWKHKFSVLQGKYNAEVPRLAADLREAKSEINDLRAKNLGLHEEAIRLRAGTPTTVTPTEEAFDPAFLTLLEARTAAAVNAKVKPLEERVQVAEQADGARRFEAFKSAVGEYVVDATGADWAAIQSTPEFQTYMAEHDPASGSQRQKLLNAAIAQGDPIRAAYFYIESFNRNKPVPATAAPAAEVPDPRQHLVVPTVTSSSAPAGEKPKRIYTNAFVNKFYVDMAKAQNQPISSAAKAEMESIDRDIHQAYMEGRIKG